MKTKIFYSFAIVLALALGACGLIPSQVESSIESVNVDENNLAIKGYDPVAYFTLNAATKGDAKYSATHNGATYLFSTASHKAMFAGDPEKYSPQFGGYCAYGVSKEKKYDIEPEAFKIVDGKLYLNLNKKVQGIWAKDSSQLIVDANGYWTEIRNTPVSDL